MESKSSEPINIEDEELFVEHSGNSKEDDEFDLIVGRLEEIVFDPGFQELQNAFCEKHCDVFDEESKENKLEYTELFQDYTRMIEEELSKKLAAQIPGFTMARLESLVAARKDELSGDVFELLCSLGDYTDFKDFMISHKISKSARKGEGSGGMELSVTGKTF